jgi:hypothetical protein
MVENINNSNTLWHWKLFEIQMSGSINRVLVEHSPTHCCTPCPQLLVRDKMAPSGPLQGRFLNPVLREECGYLDKDPGVQGMRGAQGRTSRGCVDRWRGGCKDREMLGWPLGFWLENPITVGPVVEQEQIWWRKPNSLSWAGQVCHKKGISTTTATLGESLNTFLLQERW